MLIDKLTLAITPQQYAERIKPGDNTLQFNAVYQEDSQWHFVLSDMVQKGVLEVLFVGCHIVFTPDVGPCSATRFVVDFTIVRCTQKVQTHDG